MKLINHITAKMYLTRDFVTKKGIGGESEQPKVDQR